MSYSDLFLKLLPSGKAWRKEKGSGFDKLATGLSKEFIRVDERANQLIVELNPLQAAELLPDWEKLLALPDPAFGTPETEQERRNLVTFKFSLRGGQSRNYYIDLIKRLGFNITIDEFPPFCAGISSAGDALNTSDEWRFTWRVNMLEAAAYYFCAGISSAGDPLVSWRNEVVQGIINKLKPAHTHVIFSFIEE